MRRISALLAIAVLAACGSAQSGTVTNDDGTTTSYAVARNGSDSEVRITNEDGDQAVISSGTNVAATLPLGFTVYPGATVVSNSQITTNDGKGSVLYLTTQDSPAEVAQFYRRQAEAAKIEIAMDNTTANSRMMAGEGPEEANFMMTATVKEDGTGVQLMVGEKP